MTCSATAITTALLIVPRPGRSRSGIHSRSTVTLMMNVDMPIEMGRRELMPSASTVHGAFPRVDETSMASPVPKSHSPRIRMVNVAGRVRHRDCARHRVTGTV